MRSNTMKAKLRRGDAERYAGYRQLGVTYMYTHFPNLLENGGHEFLEHISGRRN